MTNPAQVADVEARWRPLSDQETTNASAYLDDAWVMLKRRISGLDAHATADEDFSADVVRVECQMVLRVLKNPDGKTQEAIDDYSYSRDKAVSGGLLYVTDDELADLVGQSYAPSSFTIRATANPFTSCSPQGPYLTEWRDYDSLATS